MLELRLAIVLQADRYGNRQSAVDNSPATPLCKPNQDFKLSPRPRSYRRITMDVMNLARGLSSALLPLFEASADKNSPGYSTRER